MKKRRKNYASFSVEDSIKNLKLKIINLLGRYLKEIKISQRNKNNLHYKKAMKGRKKKGKRKKILYELIN